MFSQAQWLLGMNMLLSNQLSKTDEWTCDGKFCFKFSILFSFVSLFFTAVAYPFFSNMVRSNARWLR